MHGIVGDLLTKTDIDMALTERRINLCESAAGGAGDFQKQILRDNLSE